MGVLNVLILGLAAFFLTLKEANGSCEIRLKEPIPKIVTHFGSKHLVSETTTIVKRVSHETVNLYCGNGFSVYLSNYGSRTDIKNNHIKLTCETSGFFTAETTEGWITDSLNCLGTQVSNMYESRTAMPGCDGYMTLVVGQSFGEFGSLKSVAMCYDILQQQLKYVSYTAYPSKLKVLEQTQVGQLNDLGLDINVAYTKSLFKSISTTDVTAAICKDKQLKVVFTEDTFEYTNIIQDNAFAKDLSGFDEMLSVVWLRALRVGNWRHLLNALGAASHNAKFDVRVGVSGIVSMPQLQSCNETTTLTFELDSGDTLSVPSYIWAYVRALTPTLNGTDEFVVVAHNSPFLTSNGRDGLCMSMCNEVSWLKNSLFNKLQHYPIYGLVQCCRVVDVQNKLDNFVQIVEPPTPVEEEYEGSGLQLDIFS